VLALLVAAFVSGWVARGADAGRRPADPEIDVMPNPAVAGPTAAPRGDAAAQPAAGADDLLAAATADLEAVIETWLDRTSPGMALESFERSRTAVHDAATRSDIDPLNDASEALSESAEVFDELRAGLPLSAAASKRLEHVEERLARAAAAIPRPSAGR
jgi:hypothetical protein